MNIERIEFMKKSKKVVGILAITLSVISLPKLVNATAFPTHEFIGGTFYLEKQQASTTSTYTKTTWRNQRFKQGYTRTNLNDPCTDCQLLTKLVEVDDNGSYKNTAQPILTVMNEEKDLVEGSTSNPGNYYLITVRNDWTLLKTTVGYIWKIDYPA